MASARRLIGAGIAGLVVLGAALVAGVRAGWLAVPPAAIAGLAAAAIALAALELSVCVLDVARRPRLGGSGRALLLAGIVLSAAGGLVNWARGLQGYVVLAEGEAVPLFQGGHLTGFEAGPLSDPGELGLTVRLDEVKLRRPEAGAFYPESRLALVGDDGVPRVLTLAPGRPGADGTLRFLQGAFGFAPRIVLVHAGRTAFDRVVPFTTRREGLAGVAFEGEFAVEAEDLQVRGAMAVDGLAEDVRGHPRLAVEVRKGGRLLGAGELAPGRFAELAGGWRVGFAGFARWAEIDVARRSYRTPVLAGAALALAGAALWLAARWRAR